MKNAYKSNLIGRIVAIITAIFVIITIRGEWLDLYQVPMIFGNRVQHEYTLTEISDFLETFDMYLDYDELAFFANFFNMGVVVVIILSVLLIVLELFAPNAARGVSVCSLIACLLISAVFIASIIQINDSMKEATYGGIEELLRGTSNPVWLALWATVGCVSSNIREKTVQKCAVGIQSQNRYATNEKYNEKPAVKDQGNINVRFCTNCGAKILNESSFCTNCGNKLEC